MQLVADCRQAFEARPPTIWAQESRSSKIRTAMNGSPHHCSVNSARIVAQHAAGQERQMGSKCNGIQQIDAGGPTEQHLCWNVLRILFQVMKDEHILRLKSANMHSHVSTSCHTHDLSYVLPSTREACTWMERQTSAWTSTVGMTLDVPTEVQG